MRKCTLVQLFCKDFGRYVWGSLTIINDLRAPVSDYRMFSCGNRSQNVYLWECYGVNHNCKIL